MGVAPREDSSYLLARMRFGIVLAPSAVRELRALPAHRRAAVRDALDRFLRHEPTRTSKSRIKRLRGMSRPQYRLRVDDIRVFYDVTDNTVEILAIVTKAQADAWLRDAGDPVGDDEE
jgi:mRNA interferase RelE/StbE